MTGPRVQPQFDRAWAKQNGYTDQEIDEYLSKHGGDTAPSVGEGMARTFANTALGGMYSRAAANVKGAIGLAPGENPNDPSYYYDAQGKPKRHSGGDREQMQRDNLVDEHAREATFKDQHPVLNTVATGAGIAAGLKLLPAEAAASLKIPGLNNSTILRRAANSAPAGALFGGVSGAANADDGKMIEGARTGALTGAIAGPLVSAGIEGTGALAKGLYNVVLPQSMRDKVSTQMAAAGDAIRSGVSSMRGQTATPREVVSPGARRMIQRMDKQGTSMVDLQKRSAAAESPDIAAELLGKKGIDDLDVTRMLGHEAPDRTYHALENRARGEVGRVQSAARDVLGEPVDDAAFIASKKQDAQRLSAPMYRDALDGVDVVNPRVVDILGTPAGRSTYDATAERMANRRQPIPSGREVIENANGPRVRADKIVTDRVGKADGLTPEDLANMSHVELRQYRQATPVQELGKLSDKALEAEHMYLTQQQGADLGKAAIRDSQDYAEYLALRSTGKHEDARGIIEQMGYDPATFNQTAFSAGGAAYHAGNRTARIAAVEEELARRGRSLGEVPSDAAGAGSRVVPSRDAVTLPDESAAPTLPKLPAAAIQRWKGVLDDQIGKLEGMPGGKNSNDMRDLIGLRDEIESLLYEHSNTGANGENLFGAAQRTYAKPMQEAEAFAEGQRGGRTIRPADVPRWLQGEHADARATGVGNTIHEDLGRLQNGAGGRVNDPAPLVMGSDDARARMQVATRGDAAKQATIERAAEGASKRLKTRAAMGGSPTAGRSVNIAEALGEQPSGNMMAEAVRHPFAAATKGLGALYDAGRRRAIGAEMDDYNRFLLAGGVGANPNGTSAAWQMSRPEMLKILERMEPTLRSEWARKVLTGGAVGGTLAGRR